MNDNWKDLIGKKVILYTRDNEGDIREDFILVAVDASGIFVTGDEKDDNRVKLRYYPFSGICSVTAIVNLKR